VKEYCRAGQATDDSIIWRICVACWVTKDTGTHSEYVIFLAVAQRQHLRAARLRSFVYWQSFDVLLTVHLSIILVINQLDAQNLVL